MAIVLSMITLWREKQSLVIMLNILHNTIFLSEFHSRSLTFSNFNLFLLILKLMFITLCLSKDYLTRYSGVVPGDLDPLVKLENSKKKIIFSPCTAQWPV